MLRCAMTAAAAAMLDEFIPGDEFRKTFGTWAAESLLACCRGKHDGVGLVMAVFPTDKRTADRVASQPMTVLFSDRR